MYGTYLKPYTKSLLTTTYYTLPILLDRSKMQTTKSALHHAVFDLFEEHCSWQLIILAAQATMFSITSSAFNK